MNTTALTVEDLKISKTTVKSVLKEYDNVMIKLLKIYESGKKDIGVDINNLFEKASDKLYKKGINATSIIFITGLFGNYTEFVKNTIMVKVRPVDEQEWNAFKEAKVQAMEKIISHKKGEKIDLFC